MSSGQNINAMNDLNRRITGIRTSFHWLSQYE